ncbi:Protein of unknown function [Gryllus bimaculatus]|nr:Protein of unknown function [Gryllus bimaculatus]
MASPSRSPGPTEFTQRDKRGLQHTGVPKSTSSRSNIDPNTSNGPGSAKGFRKRLCSLALETPRLFLGYGANTE